jgi:hypothetical protein
MRQIPISNIIYPIWQISRRENDMSLVHIAEAVYVPISLRMTCPAVIFAVSRKDRVMGRTKILIDSTNTKKGFSQSGAPNGSSLAVNALGLFVILEIISINHKGSPKTRLIIKCLEDLNL